MWRALCLFLLLAAPARADLVFVLNSGEATISVIDAATRTVPVRVELANPGLLLKPAMFAQVELAATARGAAVTVPVSAVIDGGRMRRTEPSAPRTCCSRSMHSAIGRSAVRRWPRALTQE